MQILVEDFLQYLRHERGQAEHTEKTYAALLNKFVAWAAKQGLKEWKAVELSHLMSFLQFERERTLANEPKDSARRLSSGPSSGSKPVAVRTKTVVGSARPPPRTPKSNACGRNGQPEDRPKCQTIGPCTKCLSAHARDSSTSMWVVSTLPTRQWRLSMRGMSTRGARKV